MDYQKLGANIRNTRMALGFTQSQLAEKVGCSNSHIGQIENARGIPSLETVVSIARVLHVTVDQLLLDSLECPELVYMRDLEMRIQDLPTPIRIIACEMLQDLIEIIEKTKA